MGTLRQASTPINVYGRADDIEAEAGFPQSPSSRNEIGLPPKSSPAPRSSRFLAGFRRRRPQSESLPRSCLDEDLGHPPVCSPPPDLDMSPEAASAPDAHFSLFRNRSEHNAYNLAHRRQSGILVVFGSSPSNNQGSNEGSTYMNNNSSWTRGASKNLEGSIGCSPRDERPLSSPRRPLFVDTQLANSSSGQKRSPMGSVIDFVRSRTRTSSLSFSGSQSGPNTPSSPQSVSARASASADTNPLSPTFSPGGRPLLCRQYKNAYRSLDSDSGVGFSSNSLPHTALLIRESQDRMPIENVGSMPQVKTKKTKKKSTGLLAAAKTRATGTLRRALLGKPPKRARDAEDVTGDDDDDYTCSNYDTVRSLPASGHYGRSRVGHLHVDTDEAPQPHVIVLKLPRRRQSVVTARVSPVARAPTSDPVFDFEAWHSALDNNCQDGVYSLFMRAHKCYDLIPTSTKLVVFDTHLPVRKAFFALVYNGVRAAPLWDSDAQRFVGMLTITDFIKILVKKDEREVGGNCFLPGVLILSSLMDIMGEIYLTSHTTQKEDGHYEAGDNSEKIRALEEEEISHWMAQFARDPKGLRPLVSIDPNESLHRAVEVLCEAKVHRLPVLDATTGNISYILTHKRLIKFLSLYVHDLPRPAFMSSPPRELGIGSWGDILTCHVGTALHDALEIFLKNRVSALPLVDEQGRVVDIYAKFDVIALAAEKSYDKLDCTVQEALMNRSDWFEGVQCCRETDSLFQVLEAIVKAEVHRLIVTDEDKKVVGIISLSDILKYLVLDMSDAASDVATTPARPDSLSEMETMQNMCDDIPEISEE